MFSDVAAKAEKFRQQNMFIAALPYYSAMLELTERTLGLFHFQVGNILEAMCTCYEQANSLDKAATLLQRVIIIKEICSDGTLETSKEAFFIMGHLAELYMTLGHLTLAKELLSKMEETAAESFGDQSFECGRAMCSHAGCLERNGQIDEAEKKLLKCCELDGYMHPKDPTDLKASSIAPFNLGMIYFAQKKFEEAEAKFGISLKMKTEAGQASEHPDVVECSKMIEDCRAVPN